MKTSITSIFEGAAAKHLSVVDADSSKSNQHEIGGLPSVGFKKYLGTPGKTEEYIFPCVMAYIHGEENVDICKDTVTWYDSRRKQAHRSPEYRLYYKDNVVTNCIQPGDFFLIAKRNDNSLVLIFTPDLSVENQLRHLFGVSSVGSSFEEATMPAETLILPLKLLLEDIGIQSFDYEDVETDLEILLSRFPTELPKTSAFSALARELSDFDPVEDPDGAILGWMEREEVLFRAYERKIVSQKLREGFGEGGDDVDEFISFSLSVQNRRKSRVGHAFENHLGQVFTENHLVYEKGGGKRVTENNAKPDFLFPSFRDYHNPCFPIDRLFLLGAKTTCKDRWRQVLAEGDRLERKYLVTLEAGISSTQTGEMRAKNIQLIIPRGVHQTYDSEQQKWLYSASDFISEVRAKC